MPYPVLILPSTINSGSGHFVCSSGNVYTLGAFSRVTPTTLADQEDLIGQGFIFEHVPEEPTVSVVGNLASFADVFGQKLQDSGKSPSSFTAYPVGVPASSTAAGVAGTWSYASGFLYVCTGTGAWSRFTGTATF